MTTKVFLILILFGQAMGQHSTEISPSMKGEKSHPFPGPGKESEAIHSSDPRELYNGACAAALRGDTNTALKLLSKSVDYGFGDLESASHDSALRILQEMGSWRELITRIASNSRKDVTSDRLLEMMLEAIQDADAETIWSYGNDKLKETHSKNSIKAMLNEFDSTRRRHQFQFSTSQSSQSTATSIRYTSSQKIGETKKYKYYFMPQIFGESTGNFFRSDIGYGLHLELSSEEKKWALSEINLQSNYFDKSIDVNRLIKNYFRNSSPIICQINVSAPNEDLERLASYDIDSTNLVESLEGLEWQELQELPATDGMIVYKLHFAKRDRTPGNLFGEGFDSFFNPSAQRTHLDLVFFKDQNRLVLSLGENYGIYKTSTAKIQRWIHGEMANAKPVHKIQP